MMSPPRQQWKLFQRKTQIIVFDNKSNIKIKAISNNLKKVSYVFQWPKFHSRSDDYQSPHKTKHGWKIPTYKWYFSHSLSQKIHKRNNGAENSISWWIYRVRITQNIQSINYNYEECITNLNFTTSFDSWKLSHLDMMIESSL